jgi:hypothetical protein
MSIGSARSSSGTALVVALVLFAAPASAQAPGALGVTASGCGKSLPEVRELPARLAVELAPIRIARDAAEATLEVETSCSAAQKLVLRRGNATKTRPVDLADIEPRLRAVALAVLAAEFVRSAGSTSSEPPAAEKAIEPKPEAPANVARFEPPAAPPPPTPPPPPPPAKPDRAAPTPPVATTSESPPVVRDSAPALLTKPSFEVGASALVRWFASPPTLLTGGALDVRARRWFAHAGAAVGDQRDSIGTVDLALFTAGAGVRQELLVAQRVELFALARADIGWAHASANPFEPALARSPENGVFASASAGGEIIARLSEQLSTGLVVHGGAARGITVTADDREVMGTTGLMIGAELGLRYGFGSSP